MSKHYHFIGVGGIGMGALAALSLDKGYYVSGSDLRDNQMTERLRTRGADVFAGHDKKNIEGADCVIYSSAVNEDNPELAEARRQNIRVLRRAELLAELMDGYIGITVAGAHGKTTTTSMAVHLLEQAGFQPTTAVGGIVNGSHSHAELGKGDYFVAEADESDGTFLCFTPDYSVITNIDLEHVDHYPDWPSILDAYRQFIGQTRENGILLVCGDDKRLINLAEERGKTFRTFGLTGSNDITAVNIVVDQFTSSFRCIVDGKDYGQVFLNVPGKHNVINALACICLGLSLAIDFKVICESLKSYGGVQRRFQLKANIDDVWIIDDYAHHPTEIRATLETAQLFKGSVVQKDIAGGPKRLVAVFQPHRYSRVKGLMKDFVRSFAGGDHIIITDIYAASEPPIEGVTAQRLVEEIKKTTDRPVSYVPKDSLVEHLLNTVKSGDIVLTLGAGDITRIADQFVEKFKKKSMTAKAI